MRISPKEPEDDFRVAGIVEASRFKLAAYSTVYLDMKRCKMVEIATQTSQGWMGLDLIKLLTADLMLSLCRVGDKTET